MTHNWTSNLTAGSWIVVNNLDNLTTNLSRAILEDQSLKAKAVKDLEFKKYAETDAFKVAVR